MSRSMSLLICLCLLSTSIPFALSCLGGDPVKGSTDGIVMDPYLKKVLRNGAHPERFGVVVRFSDHPIDGDIDHARKLGFELEHRFEVLPIASFTGTAEQVGKLASYHRTEWMEYDDELELLMEESTSTINATVAWNSWIEGARHSFPMATGEGVTVAVVDTGIDAGHPDLDYGTKTIINLKSDVPGGPWYELVNSDTSYGHGTHCAGTIAGNGDASAGARRGVAPDANLVGLCVGDIGITLTNTLQGLEWVYENSKPPNPYNIRVVSNSWGGGAAEYDPEDAWSRICQKMTFENNVLVVFAMGNAGSDQHEGEELTASPTGLIPSNIGVAATERDGSGIAYFSSRGKRGLNQTYPDISAPGVKIWSASARGTEISALSRVSQNPNPYYLAISGTSMATPHISGLAALMFQVAPSLVISNRWEDYSGEDPEKWYSNPLNRIHEIEWIMEASANYIPPDGVPLSDTDGDNGVPEPSDLGETEVGFNGRTLDWAQGYGLVDAEKCVGIALTLQRLRDMYPREAITVEDALMVYFEKEVFHPGVKEVLSDRLHAEWKGEFARYTQDSDGLFLVQNQTRLIWVPDGATEVHLTLQYDPLSLEERQVSEITFVIDFGFDGSFDYEHPFLGSRTTGTKEGSIGVDSSISGMYWGVGIYGRGFKVLRPLKDGEFPEMRVPYAMGVEMTLAVPQDGVMEVSPPRPNAMVSTWGEGSPTGSYGGGSLLLNGYEYDLDRVELFHEGGGGRGGTQPPWWIVLFILVLAAGISLYIWKRRKDR